MPFGSDYPNNFGLPEFPFTGVDPQGGLFAPAFSGMQGGQPVPGTPGAGQLVVPPNPAAAGMPADPMARASAPDAGAGPAANPSVPALQSGNPLGGGALSSVGGNQLVSGAGASPGPGAGASALSFRGGLGP